VLRRTPTQDKYFRNPITIASEPGRGETQKRRSDGRRLGDEHATELRLADSAELLENLVVDKIQEVFLKLRDVHQVPWRNHLGSPVVGHVVHAHHTFNGRPAVVSLPTLLFRHKRRWM
jgi:hypothetical protein